MQPVADFGMWNGTVEYRCSVLEEVRSQAVEGLHALVGGGLEIGGVLYGERRGEVVRILAARQLECEHANGPAFVLSPNDEARFRELLKPAGGLRAVGWYGSHTRTGVVLGANDSRILERFFPERGSVALLVKPAREGPAEATFHVQGYAEPGPRFSILPSQVPENAEPPRAQPIPPVSHSRMAAPAARRPRRTRQMSVLRWVGVGIGLALFGAWFISLEPDPRAATSGPHIGLQVTAAADRNVRVEWDRTAAAVRTASAGTVRISDGKAKFALPLNTEQLRDGSLTYIQQSDAVDVSLRLESGLEESAHIVTPPRRRVPAVSPKPLPARVVVAQQSRPVEYKKPLQPLPVTERTPLTQFVLTADNRSTRSATLPDPPPAIVNTVRAPLLAAAPKLPLSLPAPTRATVIRKPSSGRLIWTGSLGRRGVVKFEGSSTTVGSLLGALPGVSARMAVFPAEFKDDGLVVYVTDASRHNRTEAPGPATGWNRLLYVWDPERVRQLTVLEAPNAGNQFARLALRNDRRSCSVIVVDWWTN